MVCLPCVGASGSTTDTSYTGFTRLLRDDHRRAQREEPFQSPKRALGYTQASCRDGMADGPGLVRSVDRELVATDPPRRQVRLDPRQAERERPVLAGTRECHPIRHEVAAGRRWRAG